MSTELHAIELPAFELDCRDWLVATPDDGTVPEEICGAPLVAILSTALIGAAELEPATAILSVGLLDQPVDAARLDHGSPVPKLIESDFSGGSARYILPAPGGQLALLAEFAAGAYCDIELVRRFERLMNSFRWAS
jgi:hypothetical protein